MPDRASHRVPAPALSPSTRLCLDDRFPALLRGEGRVQLGASAERAVVVRPPDGTEAVQIADLLGRLDGTERLRTPLRRTHLRFDDVEPMLSELVRSGLLRDRPRALHSPYTIAVLGRGLLAERVSELLQGLGEQPARIDDIDDLAGRRGILVVLTDALVVEPRVHRVLHENLLPHLHLRLVDGLGLVGPVVRPGRTPCLRCADLHRRDRDPAWPELLMQLLGRTGRAEATAVAATASIAAERVRGFLYSADGPGAADGPGSHTGGEGCAGGGPAQPRRGGTLIEVDPQAPRLREIPQPFHPACRCLDDARSAGVGR